MGIKMVNNDDMYFNSKVIIRWKAHMHPARKFSHNISKNKTLNIHSALNKQNEKNSITESFAKKFSVGSHVVSDESDLLKHKRSIVDEKISVFLDHSQNRTALFEKPANDSQVKYINRVLQNQEGTVVQILSHELEKQQIKSEDMRKLICTLVEKLSEQEKSSEYSSEDSFRLTDNIMIPYLQQEILLLQKNLSKLKSREQDLTILRSMNESEKKFLVQTLKQVEVSQKNELLQLC